MFARLIMPLVVLALLLAACGETITPGQLTLPGTETPAEGTQATGTAQDGVKASYSVPLVYAKYDDAARTNMAVALGANSNELRHEQIIAPGERWAWGEQLGSINDLLPQLQASNGVIGGGWSDLAARYANAWEGLGLKTEYAPAGRALIDMTDKTSPLLWLGEATGNADVVLVNDGPDPVSVSIQEETGQLIVVARIAKG